MEAIAELKRVGRGPMDKDALARIKRALSNSTSLVVEAAAGIVAEQGLREFVPEMIAAFSRFMQNGDKTDKGCAAKTAILKALAEFEYMGGEIYQAAAYYIQMEPVFGGYEDTAAELRSLCALSLARIIHVDAHYILADMLVDGERNVRVAAVKAITYLGAPEGELMLRLKALEGDVEEVNAECFLGLMTMAPQRSLEFVKRYLTGPTLEGAAIAIGSSHLPEGLETLRAVWDDGTVATRRALLLPIALIRSDEAFAHLIAALRTEDRRTALEALPVLRLFPAEPYVAQVREAVAARKDPQIAAKFAEIFGEPMD
jgi:HEAT repeat protein